MAKKNIEDKCTCLYPHPHWSKNHFLHKKSETFRRHGKLVPICSIGCPEHGKKVTHQ